MKNIIPGTRAWVVVRVSILLLLLFPVPSNGQVSITAEDVLGLIGSAIQLRVDESSMLSVDLGNTGANQDWDFTGLMPNDETSDRSFLAPSGTPFEGSFPEANFTLRVTGFETDEGTIFQYLRITPDKIELLGAGGIFTNPDTSVVVATPEAPFIPLPLSMGVTFSEVERDTLGNIAVVGSIEIDSTHNVVDAWGVVHVGLGSFDVIRVRGEERDRTESYVGGQLVSTTFRQGYNYEWVSPTNFVVVSISSLGGEQNPNFTVAGNIEVLSRGATQPPAEVPGNLGPAGGTNVSQTPNLTWASAPDVFAYWLQVSDDPSFTKQGNSTLLVDLQGIRVTNYVVNGLALDIAYYWRVRGQNPLGDGPWSNSLSFTTAAGVAVERLDGEMPTEFELHPNYPNPFNPETKIRFDIPNESAVRLTIYDPLGREVEVLVSDRLTPG